MSYEQVMTRRLSDILKSGIEKAKDTWDMARDCWMFFHAKELDSHIYDPRPSGTIGYSPAYCNLCGQSYNSYTYHECNVPFDSLWDICEIINKNLNEDILIIAKRIYPIVVKG